MTEVNFYTRTEFSKTAIPTLADAAKITDRIINILTAEGFDHTQIKTICDLVKVDLDARAIELHRQNKKQAELSL